jgi:spermidine/putrescine transport system permease protein
VRNRDQAFWAGLSVPGLLWLILFFIVPFYAILAVALGTLDPIFNGPVPIWAPWDMNTQWFSFVFDEFGRSDGAYQVVLLRTLAYVAIAVVLCLVIGYPVAYMVARHGGRWKVLLLIGLLTPFWISYLMRMLAWVNLLQDDGYVNDVLTWLGILDDPRNWLDGRASSVILGLVYGYVPFFILPLYASLDRIDQRLLEAAKDCGASPFWAFWRVTWPLSKQGVLAGAVITALPMFGDYYTADLLSASPKTNMIGNQINFSIHTQGQVTVGAALTVVLSMILIVLMGYYLYATNRARRELALAGDT